MKLNINGYAQHGKDTVADLLTEHYQLQKASASHLIAQAIMDENVLGPYQSLEECYEDRKNHRETWYQFVHHKRINNPSWMIQETMENGDMYVGIRSTAEYLNNVYQFDATIWVDASRRGVPKEDSDSCELGPEINHDFYIDNGGSLDQTMKQIDAIMVLLKNKKRAINAY